MPLSLKNLVFRKLYKPFLYCHFDNKNEVKKNMTDKYNQDESISEQWLAEEITNKEGKAEEVNIGQVKEILKITLDILAELKNTDDDKFNDLISKHIS